MTELVGFYPGSFYPLTNGHLDVIERACKLVEAPPAVVMQVLGEVGELREVGECPDHRDCGCRREHIQHSGELAARLLVVVPSEADGELADLLDQLEGAVALLLAQRVPQQPAE